MKSLRLKMLGLVGAGVFMLQVGACLPTEVITGLLGGLGGLIPGA
jgi:hypothetical protein